MKKLKEISIIISFLLNHPIGKKVKFKVLTRFIIWQISSTFNSRLVKKKWISPLILYLKKGLTGATGNYYLGLHDFDEMSFLLHFADNKSIFYDLGGNIGAYSLLASGLKRSKSYCFEPIPLTFQILLKNIEMNNLNDYIFPFNFGLSNKNEQILFSENLDTINHVLLACKEQNNSSIQIPVKILDDLDIELPEIVKIDVEGYEYFVLQGAKKMLENQKLKAIIIELNGSGKRYGVEDKKIHVLLNKYNFIPVSYFPFSRELKELNTFNNNNNTIYVRDIDYIQEKVKNSPQFNIIGVSV